MVDPGRILLTVIVVSFVISTNPCVNDMWLVLETE
jgi:hypothetical protein